MTNVKSTDSRKKGVVSAIKAKTGANKVTQVMALPDGTFKGHALRAIVKGINLLGL